MNEKNKMKKLIAFIGIILLLLPISFLAAQQEREFFIREYKIGPHDLLEIKVFELPELSQTVRVSEDGSISLSLLGKVKVGGLTKDSVESRIAGLLEKQYLKNAKVSVFIKEYRSNQVAVIGAVRMPGMYELIGRKTLLQMISQAGGFTENTGNKLYVMREANSGITAKLMLDLYELVEEGNQKLNIPLRPNDVINIPTEKTISIYVYGSVNRPGALEVSNTKNFTILQAIAQAGGLTDGASQKSIVIKRKDKSGKTLNLKVNLKDIAKGKLLDIDLKEGDVIYVPESIW